MSHALPLAHAFALQLARLVRHLRDDPGDVPSQKEALRELRDIAREGAISVAVTAHGVTLDGQPPVGDADVALATALIGQRLLHHGMRALDVSQGAKAADLLAVARRLASDELADSLISLLVLDGVRLVAVPAGAAPVGLDAFPAKHPDAVPAPTAVSTPEPVRPAPMAAPLPATVRSDDIIVHAVPTADVRGLTVPELFQRLEAATTSRAATSVLDELATRLEQGVRAGSTELVPEILLEVVRREALLSDPEVELAYVVAIRRMSAPSHLKIAAQMLPRRVELREAILAVLGRAGEVGADAVIEELVASKFTGDRRTYFNTLVKLQSGVPSLLHMLGDDRWYVVRNAADLLGELGATHADATLLGAMEHADERVARSAMTALGKLATPRARSALEDALRHPAPERRALAAGALAAIRDARTGGMLRRALESEADAAVQHALLAALGRLATRDAVEMLVIAAAPRRGLFRKKPTAYRLAAVQALAEAGTPPALVALERLAADDDREVRAAARRFTRQTASGGVPAVSE